MIYFNDYLFNKSHIQFDDIFIGAFGYEDRSEYMFLQINEKINSENILLFYFDDYANYSNLAKKILDLKLDYRMIERKYDDGNAVINDVLEFIKEKDLKNGHIHVDYSSMPRNWYCRMPMELHRLYPQKAFFWYVKGKYPQNYEVYPSAGIESYNIIGFSSLRTEQKRMHVIGLGYDIVRTKALLSIIDPDSYSVCAAYDSADRVIGDYVQKINSEIISQSVMSMKFSLTEFSFIYAKLCEVANEYNSIGDIIFVPDGPKPIIMAMALVAQTINKIGVSCLIVSRNKTLYEPIMVEPTDKVIGFRLYDNEL